ncbi:MAG TPA: heme lyase NrfEFG subunit NrfE [Oceanospirillales bacterium]|nr:heme lyase NrfEFG subunit NrfE [Oleispira sp.]HCM04827.1 heme lyase NrfEFG subunit NrfE [Oceanospirillales bacterium]|tara:strand:+ start:1000 stop:2934 length:1935 start_codon:yes stop_codon:yes gene_type:complete
MAAEYGHIALLIALAFACVQSVVPLIGAQTNREWLMQYARPMALGQAVFLAISFAALTYCFVVDDFSVAYVANNSNSLLPTPFKVSAVWGAHEGSLLLWVLMLGLWGAAVALFSRSLPLDMVARVIAVMGMVGVGFTLFTLFTSNPFDRSFPSVPTDGADLNPLLQDFGLIVHPPTLYMGYVGFSVAFSFAIAALLGGRLDAAWARWSRPWTTAAWVFLTIGISLGSWWAYYELGWGGWWFWDPVENASFMPWLVGTALIHSLAVTEKRGVFKSWTVLLAIFAFSLSLLGTFLVRSGVLTSVHAFASDPERGVFILALLGLCVGGSLTVYALKAPTVSSAGKFKLLSRESFLLANNALLIVATLTILLGTLYPLIVDFVSGEKLSVGSAWFNTMFVPLAAALTSIAGIGAMSRWKTMSGKLLLTQIVGSIVLAIFVAAVFPLVYAGEMNFKVALGMFVATLLVATTLRDVWAKSKGQLSRLSKLSLSYWGMIIAHLGVAVTVIGITVVSNFSVEKALKMYPGETATVSGYDFKFAQIGTMQGPNYSAHVGVFEISKQGERVTTLNAEKRRYKVKGSMMTEAAIDAGLFRDLYVSMGEPLEDGAWAMRLQVKAFMRWVWLGSIFMAIGGLLAILDKRYRMRVKSA